VRGELVGNCGEEGRYRGGKDIGPGITCSDEKGERGEAIGGRIRTPVGKTLALHYQKVGGQIIPHRRWRRKEGIGGSAGK